MYASTWLCTKIVELDSAIDIALAEALKDREPIRRSDTLEDLDIGNPAIE